MTSFRRSRRELEAAQLLAAGGFGEQAVSRAYYAAFYGAEQALLSLGESRSKHSGVIAAFGQLVVRQGGLDQELGRILRALFELRNVLDCGEVDASGDVAWRAIQDAERFVVAVEFWLQQREPTDI